MWSLSDKFLCKGTCGDNSLVFLLHVGDPSRKKNNLLQLHCFKRAGRIDLDHIGTGSNKVDIQNRSRKKSHRPMILANFAKLEELLGCL